MRFPQPAAGQCRGRELKVFRHPHTLSPFEAASLYRAQLETVKVLASTCAQIFDFIRHRANLWLPVRHVSLCAHVPQAWGQHTSMALQLRKTSHRVSTAAQLRAPPLHLLTLPRACATAQCSSRRWERESLKLGRGNLKPYTFSEERPSILRSTCAQAILSVPTCKTWVVVLAHLNCTHAFRAWGNTPTLYCGLANPLLL